MLDNRSGRMLFLRKPAQPLLADTVYSAWTVVAINAIF